MSLLPESAGWAGGLECWGIPRDRSAREDRFLRVLSDSTGNKVEPAHYGIEHEAMDDAHDVVIFEDFGNGQFRLMVRGTWVPPAFPHALVPKTKVRAPVPGL
jgi:hypothetical protein